MNPGASLPLREIVWEGNSRKIVRGFPAPVRAELGYGLYLLQQGVAPPSFRPMPTVGLGVWELRASDERGWYRVIYWAQVRGRVYVLHAFEKKSRQTSRHDLEVARFRFRCAHERVRRGNV